ncbi:MAG: hypothetical protein ACOYU5_06720 [Stygiobacter sp.]|jgi:hypothetical protein
MGFLIGSLSSILFLLISILIYFIKNPEKVDKWSYLFNKYLAFWDDKRERKIISTNLDYKVSNVAKRINKEAEGIIPFGLRIKWRSPEEVTSFVQKNEVVVVLKKNENADINIIEACLAFVPKALLPKARNVVDDKLIRSIDHFIIRKILSDGQYDSAYNFYIRNILNKLTKKDFQLKSYLDDLSQIDGIGFFTRVLLEEFRRLGSQLYGTGEESRYKEETKKFLEFLREFHLRKPGDPTKLVFNEDKIKISIAFVARKSTLLGKGIDWYIKRIKETYSEGIQRLFIFSYAKPFEESITDEKGFVKKVIYKKEFDALNKLEYECRKLDYLRLIKKQKYYTRDVNKNRRSAKYLLYEFIR